MTAQWEVLQLPLEFRVRQFGRDGLQPVVQQQLRNERWWDKAGATVERRGEPVSARVMVCQPDMTFATSVFLRSPPARPSVCQ